MVYVRSHIEWNSSSLEAELESVFASKLLQGSKSMADRVLEKIRHSHDLSSPGAAKIVLHESLSILDPDGQIQILDYPDSLD